MRVFTMEEAFQADRFRQDQIVRLKHMLRVCIAELRELGAHTVPTQAENLLNEIDN